MQEAILLARKAVENNEGGPFGCVVVKNDKIIGRGSNKVVSTKDPTAHAEIIAIRDACATLDSFQLDGCEVYTSCEPCPMCLGALYWARPSAIYYAVNRTDAANIGFDDSMIYDEVAKAIHERSIPLKTIGRDEAIKVFELWKNKTDKTPY